MALAAITTLPVGARSAPPRNGNGRQRSGYDARTCRYRIMFTVRTTATRITHADALLAGRRTQSSRHRGSRGSAATMADEELYVDYIRGYRSWHVNIGRKFNPDLSPVFRGTRPWTPGVNTAACDSAMGHIHTGDQIPVWGCGCGFYGYYQPLSAFETSNIFTMVHGMRGAIRASGYVQL